MVFSVSSTVAWVHPRATMLTLVLCLHLELLVTIEAREQKLDP